MTTFGIDISHHQDLSLDLARCRREAGIEFVFIKSTEGASFVDPEFTTNLHKARAAGQLVAAYHYVRGGAFANVQAMLIEGVVPRDVPVILDVESGSGDVMLVRNLVAELRVRGYRVPLLYLPRWYWQQLGSPSLVGLPPLWSSRYPDNVINDLSVEWATVPASYWTGYGGLDVAVLQFTSSARVAGYAPLDANAFRGTRQRLAELLGYEKRRGSNVHNLILAREAGTPRVWVGDGMTRRHVVDEVELAGLQYWITERGGNATINEGWEDLRVLGAPVAADIAELKARPVGSVDVDEAALAVAIATEMESNGVVGITPEQVETAVRSVFADAGSDDTE